MSIETAVEPDGNQEPVEQDSQLPEDASTDTTPTDTGTESTSEPSLEEQSETLFKQVQEGTIEGGGVEVDKKEVGTEQASEPEEPASDADLVVTEDQLDSVVQFPDGEKVSLRDLKDGVRSKAQRDAWIKKTSDLARTKQAYSSAVERLGKYAESIDIPHLLIGQVISENIKAGIMPAQMFDDIDAVFKKYVKNGEYNAKDLEFQVREHKSKYQQSVRERQLQDKEATVTIKESLIEFSSKYGQQPKLVMEMIADHAEKIAAKSGEWLTPIEAYEQLQKLGKIRKTVARIAPPSKKKQIEILRSRSTPIRPTVGNPSPKSAEDEIVNIWSGIQRNKQ